MIVYKNGGMTIDDNGFINDADLEKHVRSEYRETLDAMLNLNRIMHEKYEKLEISSTDEIGVFLCAIFCEIHRSYETVIILLARGLSEQAIAIIRSMCERLFILSSVAKDAQNLELWHQHQNYESEELKKAIEKGYPGLEYYKQYIECTNKKTAKTKSQKMSIYSWAKKAGMVERYNVEYRVQSGYTHYSISSYRDGTIKDGNQIIGIFAAPKFDDFSALAATAIQYSKEALKIIDEYTPEVD